MPTKSGRIKLADVRQGKTLWIAFRLSQDEPYVPKPYLVVEGAKWRWAGIVYRGDTAESYSYPAFALCHRYSGKDESGQYKSVIIQYFHTERNSRIQELPDGSHVYSKAFTTRRRCQRLCDELNRGSVQRYWELPRTEDSSSLVFTQGFITAAATFDYAKYESNVVAPTAPWEDPAPDVPGDA